MNVYTFSVCLGKLTMSGEKVFISTVVDIRGVSNLLLASQMFDLYGILYISLFHLPFGKFIDFSFRKTTPFSIV